MNNAQDISGLLVIDKPIGPTSHDIVAQIRKKLGRKIKVGHTGTLDPFASGLLLVAIGPATRLIQYSHAWPKTYVAEITLGATSTTDDLTGTTATTNMQKIPTNEEVTDVLSSFVGEIKQIPPSFSAIKIGGKRMFEFARRGESVSPKPRLIIIHQIKLVSYQYPIIKIKVDCGTGTYIRALARDIGQKLTTGAYCSALRRTRIGTLDIAKSITPSMLSATTTLLPPATLLSHLPSVHLLPAEAQTYIKGQSIPLTAVFPASFVSVWTDADKLIGVGQFNADSHQLQPKTNILQTEKLIKVPKHD